MRKTTQLRKLLEKGEIIIAPGAYDALSAKLIEQAGFQAIYMTGAGVASSQLGVPDIGLITMTEMVTQAKNIVNATNIPVISDADTGYGNAINVMRTIREFEKAGVAAVHIEDQITPKKCGHWEGKQIISTEEMVNKIKAAVEARGDPDFIIIARTDSRSEFGLEDAIERGRAYSEAGADVIFVEAPQTVNEIRIISESIKKPLLINLPEGGKTPILPLPELQEMGYRIAIFPSSLWMACIKAMQDVLKELNGKGNTDDFRERMVSREELFDFVDISFYRKLEEQYTKSD